MSKAIALGDLTWRSVGDDLLIEGRPIDSAVEDHAAADSTG